MKKSDVRKIIKEEVKKALSEMRDPLDRIEKEFPEVLGYDWDQKLSSLHWEVITTKKWTNDDASEFQSAMGYSPMGYGGPYKFREEILGKENFGYKWHCAASSG